MKKKEFVQLEKRLLPDFPGFAINGSLMFIAPVEHTLRGFCFDTSGFDKKAFYLCRLFMPMYVPAKHLHLTFGDRLGSNRRWHADQPGLETALRSAMLKELPFLESLKTAKDVAQALAPFLQGSNPHCHEALAYALVQAGDIPAALAALDTLLTLIDSVKRANPSVTWELEIASRAQLLKAKLMVRPHEANAQLEEWEFETVQNLGLNDFWHKSRLN
jgi:hypothetical protein